MFNRKPGKHALLFIFITVLVDMIGIGIIIPVMPKLIVEVSGYGYGDAARWGGYLLFVYALMQFFMSPVLGALSDKFGRRPVILLSLGGYAADFMIMGLAPNLVWLFFGRMMSGGFAATYATANAYIADVTPPEKRAANFGLMGAAFGIGFTIGPVIGGLLGELGPRIPFFAASALALANVLYGFIVLPETLPEADRRAFNWKRANPGGNLFHMRRYRLVLWVFAAFFLIQLAHNALVSTWAYYAYEKFTWSESQVGLSLMVVGITTAIVQGGLTRTVIPKIGETRAALLGVVSFIISLLGYAFATQGWMIYGWIIVGSLGGFIMPSIQGIMSRTLPPNEQGELQGAIASVMSITMIIGPIVMTQIFAAFTHEDGKIYFPGAAFVAAAILATIAIAPLSRTLAHIPAKKTEEVGS
ncbi:MAG: TCR/Tet family MFS transporter [Parvularculaceae bacterium]